MKRFEAATTDDPGFALAFSALARSYWSLRYDNEAQRASAQAMRLVTDALPPQERHTIAATDHRINNRTDEAIAAYEALLKVSPNDTMLLYELGIFLAGFVKARSAAPEEEGEKGEGGREKGAEPAASGGPAQR